MDYHNVVPPPTVNSTLNLMQPLQYPHFIGHAGDMAPMTEKIELWEQENHVSSFMNHVVLLPLSILAVNA